MAKKGKGAGVALLLGGGLLGILALSKKASAATTGNGDGTNGTNGNGNGNGNGTNGNGTNGNGNGGFVPLANCLDAIELLQYPRTQAGVSTFQEDWNRVNRAMRGLLPGGGAAETLEMLEGLGVSQSHPLFTGEPADVDSPYVTTYGTIQVDGDCGPVTATRAIYAAQTQGWWVAVQLAADLDYSVQM